MTEQKLGFLQETDVTSLIPTEEDPSLFNRWLYGIEELSSQLGLPPSQVENYLVHRAQESGYEPFDVLTTDRRFLYSGGIFSRILGSLIYREGS